MKYDKIVDLNQEIKQKNIGNVERAINDMINRKERISITALAEYTKLDRSYFYRSVEARSLVEKAKLAQGECFNPKKVIFDRACRSVNRQLEICIQGLRTEIKRLKQENQKLVEENTKLKNDLRK